MVAHCSDFFQVCARSSLDVFTASSRSPMLSYKLKKKKSQRLPDRTGRGPHFRMETLTLRGMTSLVTRKSSRWKSDTMSRNDVEEHWDRYVAKL